MVTGKLGGKPRSFALEILKSKFVHGVGVFVQRGAALANVRRFSQNRQRLRFPAGAATASRLAVYLCIVIPLVRPPPSYRIKKDHPTYWISTE